MENWLLLSNCQTVGLANSFQLLNPALRVTAVDIWTYRADPQTYNRKMAEVDRLVVHPDIAALPEYDDRGARMINYLPSIDFGAYHPDTGYFQHNGGVLDGPMMAYHSILAVAAYNAGLHVADTVALFAGKTYEKCGYMADWAPQRAALIRRFADHGVPLAGVFPHWGRKRAFMYSVNHPRIEQIHDVARQFLHALGLPSIATDIIPGDNMIHGPCMPVYDEVGEALGVRGSYLFKLPGEFRYVPLVEYLAGCLAVYQQHPRHAIQPHPTYRARYDHVLSVVRGEA